MRASTAGVTVLELDAIPMARMTSPDVCERPVEHLSPLRDDADEVAELLGLVHVVGAEDDRAALLPRAEDGVAQHFLVDRIQPRRRLVQDQQLGPVDHRGDELHLLLHALRQRLDLRVLPLRQAHPLEPARPCSRAADSRMPRSAPKKTITSIAVIFL